MSGVQAVTMRERGGQDRCRIFQVAFQVRRRRARRFDRMLARAESAFVRVQRDADRRIIAGGIRQHVGFDVVDT